jgi:hypothetical protein
LRTCVGSCYNSDEEPIAEHIDDCPALGVDAAGVCGVILRGRLKATGPTCRVFLSTTRSRPAGTGCSRPEHSPMAGIRGCRRPWAGRSTGAERASGVIVTWFVELGDEVTPASLLAGVALDKVDAQVQPEESGGRHRAGGGEQGDSPGLGDRPWRLNPRMGAGELVLQPAANQW